MRKLILILTLCLFVVSTTAFAQTVVPQNIVSTASLGAKVGVAAGVKGSVQLARDGGVGKVVSSGAEIFLGDKISTDAKGSLQILLLDQTTFTIGANSAIVVDQFIYDPATDAGKVSVRVVEGTFRFITGKIAHKNPENMQVDLPNGTIGIRGTMVMGRVHGTNSRVILTGPGDKNNTGNRHGEITVGGKGGDSSKSVRIAKTGFGTEIEGEGAPKGPFKVPQSQLDEMTSELSPQSGEEAAGEEKSEPSGTDQSSSSSGESATEQAGQANVDVGDNLETAGTFTELSTELGDQTTKSVQDTVDEEGQTLDGIATVRDLGKITTGQAHFEAVNFPLFNTSSGGSSTGRFDIKYDIDFAARTVGGGNSNIYAQDSSINSPTPKTFVLPKQSFDNASSAGLAIFSYSNLPDNGTGSCISCTANAVISIGNSGGNVATGAIAFVTITNTVPSTTTVIGVAEAPRQPNLS